MITPSLRLVEQLGVGGMGSVWVADHLALHTRVAVKFMAKELAANVDVVSRFGREAAAASQVKSPHVVQMFDHGVTHDGIPFITMELLEGEDLARRARRVGRPSPPELASIVVQVGKALGKAHERGIVHRDIKPENIFLCESDDGDVFVKVLDFGIAKVNDGVSTSTRTGAVMGTAYYMSPEQIVGSKGVDHRTDIWALGVVAYEMLTGVRPFDGETVGALALAIHATNPPPPSSINTTLPPQVDAWFARACARDVAQRYQNVKEMTRALAAILGEARGRVSSDVDGSAPMPPLANTPQYTPQYTPQPTPQYGTGPAIAQSMPMAQSAPAMMPDAPKPLTTMSGQAHGSYSPPGVQRSRAPIVVGAIVGVAAIVGAVVFITRSSPPPPPPPTTVVDSPDPPEKKHPKNGKEKRPDDPAGDPTPVPTDAVSSPPATSTTVAPTPPTTTNKNKPGLPTVTVKPTPSTSITIAPSVKTKPSTTTTGPSEPPLF
jgi:serine/threonine-protein kinase